ncbi:MAG: hypothetical protein PHU14_10530 [Methylovulum sp.]|nr:hypothetical protein [Methylovulum sp.]
MTITLNTPAIRKRAVSFAKEFSKATYEMGEAQSFIIGLCDVFGLQHRRAVRFEERVKKLGGKRGRIDGFFPGLLLVEMKSTGADLDQAFIQATEYFPGLKDEEMPRCVLVSDFANLHLYNLETKEPPLKIKLADFPQAIDHFKFIAGYEAIAIKQQEHINKAAAEKMASLHDAIKATGYVGKDLETYLVRLLFCLFAEDTGLFDENGLFLDYLINHTKADGSDLHGELLGLFDTLNKPDAHYLNSHPDYQGPKRLKNLPEHRARFPYINGELFADNLAHCDFDETARTTLIECARLDWSDISPAIFGSLFQAIMHFDDEAAGGKTKKRRELGAHYTSEENILKVINPLFMDDLRKDFGKCGNSKPKLNAFHDRLATLNFFDPACGCGNFLVIAYRELRLLELAVIQKIWGDNLTAQINVDTIIRCNVHQFHGIEIDESAAQIATLALWLTDHQMNLKVQSLGMYYNRIPLKKKANIVCANALRIDWAQVIAPQQCSFIMGNPPFIGYSYQTKDQKADLAIVFKGMNGAGVLDYVAAWHVTAARYIQAHPAVPVAFVSTNSISQGEQVAILWTELLRLKIILQFAHRTFQWNNEGRGIAAVHCVIMGFGLQPPASYRLYDYGDDIKGIPTEIAAKQINPYLVDAPTVLIDKRRKPLIADTPEIKRGSSPVDGGNLLLSQTDVDNIRQNDPVAAKYIRPFLMGEEFINNIPRYCLWLKDSTPADRIQSPEIKRRVGQVKAMRLASRKVPTQKLADTPYLFGEVRISASKYLAIPKVSSENRFYIPIAYLDAEVICGDKLFFMPDASLLHFGILTSHMHNAWMRTVCGRLKSDYSYSNTIVYNNYPFPPAIKPAQQQKIETAAQAVLAARTNEAARSAEQGQTCSLAQLYAAGNMPQALSKAHAQLDKAVDAAYGYKSANKTQGGKKDDAERVAFLFVLYQDLVAACV